MIVILPDGQTRELPWSQAGVVGYAAATVILKASDTRAMLRMMRDRPEEFYACMAQFNARFVENRAPMREGKGVYHNVDMNSGGL